jgi:hypothetical protein
VVEVIVVWGVVEVVVDGVVDVVGTVVVLDVVDGLVVEVVGSAVVVVETVVVWGVVEVVVDVVGTVVVLDVVDVSVTPMVVVVDKEVFPNKVCVVAIEESDVVVSRAGQVVDSQMQSNQSPLLNFEYTRTLVPFDK